MTPDPTPSFTGFQMLHSDASSQAATDPLPYYHPPNPTSPSSFFFLCVLPLESSGRGQWVSDWLGQQFSIKGNQMTCEGFREKKEPLIGSWLEWPPR